MSTITGNDVRRGDVVKSAAMREPERVVALSLSSTGRTVELRTESGHVYRVGRLSKVRLVSAAATAAAPCPICGSRSADPTGTVLHRFTVGERIRSVAGMRGVILTEHVRHNGHKVRWDNGAEGWHRIIVLRHDEAEGAEL